MIVRDENGARIKCDKCEVMSPPAEALLKGHGLNNMGWHCSGGTHLCPAHPHPADEPCR